GVVTTLAGSPGVAGSADGTGAAASFNSPDGLAFDGAGNLYVADSKNATIRQVLVATGAVTTVAGIAGQAGVAAGPLPARLNFPQGLAMGPGPALFISDGAENVLLEVH
ncbi:MAG: hypothetical protein ACYDCL_21255, partial [Myxococcales bacterium]